MSVPVHRCRFMDYERPGISAMAFNSPSLGPKNQPRAETRVAMGRANGDIEIWNPFTLTCETVIPGAKGRTIDDICWVSANGVDRLFSVGGTDTLVEWDLASGLPKQFVRSDAGVIWAVSPSPDGTQLAVATEMGSVVIFNVDDNRLEFAKRLSGADTSLASLAWQDTNTIVAGGNDGKIRVWQVDQARVVATLRVDKQRTRSKPGMPSNTEETVVWTVLPLPTSNQLVSGDSNGFVKIWDTKTWSLQQSLQSHEGDVLCLTANYNGTSLFSSGLDQKIVNTRLTDPKIRRWTVMNSSVAHTHDIRCMASFETGKTSLLLSGGLEPTFVVSDMASFVNKPHRKVAATRCRPQAEIVGEYVVEFNEQIAAIWHLNNGGRKLRAKVKISGDDFLTCASFDPELGLLALGTLYSLRLFMIDFDTAGAENEETAEAAATATISPVPLPNWDSETGARFLKWAEPEKLVVVTDADTCLVYDTDSGAKTPLIYGADDEESENDEDEAAFVAKSKNKNRNAIRTLPNKLPYTNRIALLAVCNGLVALARYSRYIDIYTITGKHVSALPIQSAEITAMEFRAGANLVVATADREVTEFDTISGQLTSWSRLNQGRMPPQLAMAAEPAYGIFSGVGKSDRAWLWGPSWLATIDFGSMRPLRKRRSREGAREAHDEDDEEDDVDVAVVEDGNSNSDDLPVFWMSQKYKPIFYAGALGSELFVSEKPDLAVNARKFWSNRRIQI